MATKTEALAKPDKVLTDALTVLRKRADSIVVRTQEDYVIACQIAVDGRAYIKDVGYKLDPGIDDAKRHLDFLKNAKAQYVDPAKQIVEVAAQKAEAWKKAEREAAAREQERINAENRRKAQENAEAERKEAEARAAEERKRREKEIEQQRKAGELKASEAERLKKEAANQESLERQQAARDAEDTANNVEEVTVKPAVPKVYGIRARVNWKFKIVEDAKIPRAYLKADEVAIGEDVRKRVNGETDAQHKARVEALIPGIEVYAEDSV